MEKLIDIFNTQQTHIEIDAINQYDNGYTDDKSIYTYTIYLIDNNQNDPIDSFSVINFSEKELIEVESYFTNILSGR